LTIGWEGLPGGRARSLCQAALLTTAAGLALTLLGCDLMHLVLITQLQPWRWLWFGLLLAALLLPQVVLTCWQAGTVGRTTAMLLIAGWIFASGAFALALALAAVASPAFMRRLRPSETRWVLWGACGLLAIAVTWRLASDLQFTEAYYLDIRIPLRMRRAMSFARDGSVPVMVIALAWWLALVPRRRAALMLLGALAVIGCAALTPQTWARWTARQFPPQRVARFAPLRDRIPPGSEVFWTEPPIDTWLLLGRPSYLSVIQTSGMVFSRAAALELQRRALALSSAVAPQLFLDWDSEGLGMNLSLQQLQRVCQIGEFEFLVTAADLGVAPLAVLPRESAAASTTLRLYRCGPKESRKT
jgi:hypothetical protein